ncbi:glycosyltransferase family 2 protein [Lichenifustis flavocetrariae]|uniref:Glycosyltransferase family 2 protein n=1 Tax=Lichenifustis flavocetrariae TaxID=2949735 RepID=A0AA41YZQ5_9HYPH|nr:glycosyltransferase family A protein [Lichenifustis flavocetrariae]MCW6506657.1 glycosyltransferase family 2 protein [Lichenifustis flavocetrariae]
MFSVLIPTKNRPDLLERALRSVLRQQGPSWEAIVADDGDGSGEAAVLAMGDSRITALRTGARGQVPARNMALARARAPFIAFLDDDDWWEAPDHLAHLARALAAGADLAYADGRIVRENDGGVEIPFLAGIDQEAIRHDNMLLVSGIAFTREAATRVGPFDETLPIYWDWDFYLRLAAGGAHFTHAGGDGVRISARQGTASSETHRALRQAQLDRLSALHGLTGLVLRNHESIALDQAAALVE